MDDFAVDDVTDGDDTTYKVNNAAAVVINTDGDSTGNDANTAMPFSREYFFSKE